MPTGRLHSETNSMSTAAVDIRLAPWTGRVKWRPRVDRQSHIKYKYAHTGGLTFVVILVF